MNDLCENLYFKLLCIMTLFQNIYLYNRLRFERYFVYSFNLQLFSKFTECSFFSIYVLNLQAFLIHSILAALSCILYYFNVNMLYSDQNKGSIR